MHPRLRALFNVANPYIKFGKDRCALNELKSQTDAETAEKYLDIMIRAGMTVVLLQKDFPHPVNVPLAKSLQTALLADNEDEIERAILLIEKDLKKFWKEICDTESKRNLDPADIVQHSCGGPDVFD